MRQARISASLDSSDRVNRSSRYRFCWNQATSISHWKSSMFELKNKKTIHTKWHSVYPIQLDDERRTRHLIHKKHDVKDNGEEEEKRVKMVDTKVVNLIAKWLQLFILQMDSYIGEECKVIKTGGKFSRSTWNTVTSLLRFVPSLEVQTRVAAPDWKNRFLDFHFRRNNFLEFHFYFLRLTAFSTTPN